MKFRVIGFNDEVRKFSGPATRFLPVDCFDCDVLPSEMELRLHAIRFSYLPRKGRGVHPTKCEPVYFYREDIAA